MSCLTAVRKSTLALALFALGSGVVFAAPVPPPDVPAESAAAPLGNDPPGFQPEVRLGAFGTVPGLVFNKFGKGHLIYRKNKTVLYRFFDGQSFGPEQILNDDNSRAEAGFLDRNQPKIALEPDSGAAWVVWGGEVRQPPDRNMYLRGVTPDGQIATGIRKYRFESEPDLSPEDVAVAFDSVRKRIHIYSVHVGLPEDDDRNAHYDFTLTSALGIATIKQLGPAQKNIFGFSGPERAYEFSRLHVFSLFQTTDTSGDLYIEHRLHPEPPLGYSPGAFRYVTLDDNMAHFGMIATDGEGHRIAEYLRLNMSNENDVEEVRVDNNVGDGPYGLAQPAVTAKGNIFIVYDKDRPDQGNREGIPAPAFVWRRAGAGQQAPFTPPRFFPDYPADGDAHAPAAAALGERIYIVWGDKLREGLYFRTFDFEQISTPTPTKTPTPTFTATRTRTPTRTFTPTATPTPKTLNPGGSVSTQVTVGSTDTAVELMFRVVSPPIPVGCDVTVTAKPPTDPETQFAMTGVLQTKTLENPEVGTWTITASSENTCPQFQYYLFARAVPRVSMRSGALFATCLLGTAALALRRRRNRQLRRGVS